MSKNSNSAAFSPLALCLFVLASMAAIFFAPSFFSSSASVKKDGNQSERRADELKNYDIRTDKAAFEKLANFRQAANKDAAQIARMRKESMTGENNLRTEIPSLRVEYNAQSNAPEVIAPDVRQGRHFLTAGSGEKHSEILRNFLKRNQSLVGVADAQTDSLETTADYTNPDGNLSFTSLAQKLNGIPVFRGEIKAAFTKSGEMLRVINNLAPEMDENSLSKDFGDPLEAVRAAAGLTNTDAEKLDLRLNAAASNDLKIVFGEGDWATVAEKTYFPTESGVARAAWLVLVWKPANAYYVIVDAEDGTMLWRKNISEDQTQAATFNVYANPNAMINVAESPFPLTPGPNSPNSQQGAALSRTLITRIGNEAPYTFNNNGWINDGGTETDGNAVEAGLDRDSTDGIDAVNGRVTGTNRTFDFAVNPLNPNTNTGDSPTPAGEAASGCTTIAQPHSINNAQRAAITQLFYIANRYHDEVYRLGFTESARNFQASNFGRGGTENDRVSAEAQDCSGTNNANFATPADGSRGRMQMYLWTAPNPDIDGSFDAEVVIHELTHGLSNRLHGNSFGLVTNMARGMGEGWSDFYAQSLLSEPTDPINGIYALGGYATYAYLGSTNNYYYGIRRYPKAIMSVTGGVNNKPHNAYTFSYLNADCNSRLNNTNFAFNRGVSGASDCDQVHNIGEIWSSTLWEVRARFITRLGWAEGNRRILQYVTDGMKLAPLDPTFLQERDAIIAAAQASLPSPQSSADVADIWEGFRIRGMGAGAGINNQGTGSSTTSVTEAFDAPNLAQVPALTISGGNNNGYAEPGENILINVALQNNTGTNADNVTAQIVGGGSASYGTITNNSLAARQIAYSVPANTACGSALTLTINVNSSLGAVTFTRVIFVGVPQTTLAENFDGVTAPAIPPDWTATSVQSGINFVTATANSDSAPNSAFAADPTATGGGTDLTSPAISIQSPAATIVFRQRYDTEPQWDGGVLEISIGAGGAFQDITAAGGRFLENGYNTVLGNGTNNPLSNRAAWSGFSNGYLLTTVQLPASAAGQTVRLKWRFGADNNTVGRGANPGWNIDNITVTGSSACAPVVSSNKARADFDGDGKTDLSVFRPLEGNWYLNRSTDGFGVIHWGISSDTLIPGDYDGDGKTDLAIWRPATGEWYFLRSTDGGYSSTVFGLSGDIPQVGDYDGDGKTDIAVFRPSTNVWYVEKSTGGYLITQFGATGDIPVRADYDGDGKTDMAIYRAGQWWLNRSRDGVTVLSLGTAADKPVPADYDGDKKDDIAVYRPTEGNWYIFRSTDGVFDVIRFGLSDDIPVPGDYDGDGKTDTAIYRSGVWWLNRTRDGVTAIQYGISSDKPVPAAYIP